MRKFKPNMLTTFMFNMLEMIAPFSVGTVIMGLLINNGRHTEGEILSIIPLFFLLVILITVFSCVLNLVTLPFTKYSVFLFDDRFSRGETVVKYEDVTRIALDSGFPTRMGPSEPCYLDCYSGDELLISIKHPSLLMSFLLMRRCKNAKFRYARVKKVIGMWVLCLVMCIALGLYGLYGAQTVV